MELPFQDQDLSLPELLARSIFWVPETGGFFRYLRIPGVVGYLTGSSQAQANFVHILPGGPGRFADTIQQVIKRYAAENKRVSCLIGPTADPPNQELARALEAAGFNKARDLAGMVLSDLWRLDFQPEPVEIREVDAGEMDRQVALIARAYGKSQEAAELTVLKFSPARRDVHFRAYLAYIDGQAVGFAYALYIPDQALISLRQAGTLPEYRRQGVYRSLVARRLRDARAAGLQAALVSSIRGTSTSTLLDIGFEEFCNLSVYTWEGP